jgi:hypothetical protein
MPDTATMIEAQNKIVSIEAFRTARPADRTGTPYRGPAFRLSQRGIEHRERMLRFLRTEAVQRKETPKEDREVQGCLLL